MQENMKFRRKSRKKALFHVYNKNKNENENENKIKQKKFPSMRRK